MGQIRKRKAKRQQLRTEERTPADQNQTERECCFILWKIPQSCTGATFRSLKLKNRRKDFQTMMDNVNRILRLVITGQVEDENGSAGCSGNCSGCSGCR